MYSASVAFLRVRRINIKIKKKKKKNASKRSKKLVNNLNSALNLSNYDDISNVTVQKIYTACLEKQKSSQIKSISWTNVKPPFVGRQSRTSVIIGQPSPFGEAKQALECIKAWEPFFSDDIIKTIVTHTNNRIKKIRESFKSSSKTLFTFTCDVDEIEMRAFIGLVYFRGLSGLNNHDTEVLYNPIMGPNHLAPQ